MLWGAINLSHDFKMRGVTVSSFVDTTWVRSFSKRARIRPLPGTVVSCFLPWKWKMAPSNSCGILQVNRHFRRNHDSGRKSMQKKEYTVIYCTYNIYIYMYIYIYYTSYFWYLPALLSKPQPLKAFSTSSGTHGRKLWQPLVWALKSESLVSRDLTCPADGLSKKNIT